jgi:hypothetical protein
MKEIIKEHFDASWKLEIRGGMCRPYLCPSLTLLIYCERKTPLNGWLIQLISSSEYVLHSRPNHNRSFSLFLFFLKN